MKTDRKKLLAILQAVKCGLANKEIIEQSTSFLFTNGKVMTYSDEVSVSHPIDIPLEGAVQAKEFFALLNKIKDDEIELEVVGSELQVRGAKFKSGVPMQEHKAVDDILRVLGKAKDWQKLPEAFIESIGFCLFSAGRDMTKPLLTCLFFKDRDVLSSDGFRISRYDMGEGVKMTPLCLPATAANELRGYKPVKFATTEGWVHFITEEDVVFSCRTRQGAYPAEKAHAWIDAVKGEKAKLPEGLEEALDRAGVFSSGAAAADDRIRIVLEEGLLTVRGEGSSGWFEETNRVRYRGETMTFEVNPEFLLAILRHTDEVTIGEKQLKFEGAKFEHVVRTLTPKKNVK